MRHIAARKACGGLSGRFAKLPVTFHCSDVACVDWKVLAKPCKLPLQHGAGQAGRPGLCVVVSATINQACELAWRIGNRLTN